MQVKIALLEFGQAATNVENLLLQPQTVLANRTIFQRFLVKTAETIMHNLFNHFSRVQWRFKKFPGGLLNFSFVWRDSAPRFNSFSTLIFIGIAPISHN